MLQTRAGQTEQTKSLTRRHRPDYRLVLWTCLLVLVGLIVLFAISPYQIERLNSQGSSLDQAHYMLKQGAYLAVGVAAFIGVAITPIGFWKKYKGWLLLGALGLCLLLAIMGAVSMPPALCHNGACRWFDVGFGTVQPAELLKFAVLIYGSIFIGRRIADGNLNNLQDTLVPLGIIVGLSVLFVIGLQKDMGTGITLVALVASMLYIAGLDKKLLGLAVGALVVVGLLMIVLSPHRIARVTTLFDSASSTDAANYHIDMATIAIGSGGLFGKGLGGGVQAFGYLPEALNDSIFAVLGETFGFLGLLVIMVMFILLLERILRVAQTVDDPTKRMMAAGVFGWIAAHFIINIGAMIGLLPLTGVTLPFLSFGGTSLVLMMAALGLVYQVSQYSSHRIVTEGNEHETVRSRRGIGRSRDTGARRYQRAR